MKVLFGYLTYQYRGGSKFQLDFAGYFRNAQVGFITSNTKICYEEDAQKIGTIHRIPPTKQFFQRLRAMKELAKEYDVLYLNKAVLNPFEMYIAKNAGFRKVVFHSHAVGKDCSNTVVKAFYHILHRMARTSVETVADKKCACSFTAAKWLFGEASAKDAEIIKNGIDVERFAFSPEIRERKREELGIDSFCVLHVGSFSAVKNQGYLIDAFDRFHEDHPNSSLMLAGEGELMADVRQKTEALGLTDAVSFLGQRNDVHELLQAADLFVLPSLEEGFSYVALEAQTAGLPCVISSAVPEEARITDGIRVIDVAHPCEELSRLMAECTNLPRSDRSEVIRNAGYDLKTCALKLEYSLEQMLCEK